MKRFGSVLIVLFIIMLITVSGCFSRSTYNTTNYTKNEYNEHNEYNEYNEFITDEGNSYTVIKGDSSSDAVSQSDIDDLTERVEKLRANAEYFAALQLIEDEGVKCEEYIELYESIACEYAYYILYMGEESKYSAYQVLGMAEEYCGKDRPLIEMVYEDVDAWEGDYSEDEAIKKAGGDKEPEAVDGKKWTVSGGTSGKSTESKGSSSGKASGGTESKESKKTTTAYEQMMEFVTLKPGKWGDIDFCELYDIGPIGDWQETDDFYPFIIKRGTCEADAEYLCYYANKNGCELMNNFGSGHSELYYDPLFGTGYRVYYHMGYGAVYSFYLYDGIQEEVYISERKCNSASELIDKGWKKLEGKQLSTLK